MHINHLDCSAHYKYISVFPLQVLWTEAQGQIVSVTVRAAIWLPAMGEPRASLPPEGLCDIGCIQGLTLLVTKFPLSSQSYVAVAVAVEG